MIRLVSLSSGSCGNAIYIESARTKLLVDAGNSLKYIGKQLEAFGVRLSEIDAVLLTHEHHDHIKSAGSISRRFGTKVLANAKTLEALPTRFGQAEVRVFPDNASFEIGDFEIKSVPHSHDCRAPVGFVLHCQGKKICVATDLGRITPSVEEGLRGAHVIVLESNHDPKMLADGRYPVRLKARVAGDQGHLSNSAAGKTLARLATGDKQKVLLAHLSEENNSPDVAAKTVRSLLMEQNIDSIKLGIAPRLSPSATVIA